MINSTLKALRKIERMAETGEHGIAEVARKAIDSTCDDAISARDYFAAKFIAAWVITLGARHGQPGYSDRDAMWEAHRLGSEQADAMLAERAK